MNLEELKLNSLGIDKQKFGRIFAFVDFGNVNYWYEKDRRDWNDNELGANQKLIIDIPKLAWFLDLFCEKKMFYYGWHKRMKQSWHIVILAEKNGFKKVTKEIQYIEMVSKPYFCCNLCFLTATASDFPKCPHRSYCYVSGHFAHLPCLVQKS